MKREKIIYKRIFKENKKMKIVLGLSQGNVSKALDLLDDLGIRYEREYTDVIYVTKRDWKEIIQLFNDFDIEFTF